MIRLRARLFGADLRRAFGARLWLCVPFVPLLILLDNVTDWAYIGRAPQLTAHYFFFNSVTFGGVFGNLLLVMLCVIPFATAAQAEAGTRYALYASQRVGVRWYCLSKYLAGLISGGTVNALGFAAFFALTPAFMPVASAESLESMSAFPFVRYLTPASAGRFAWAACWFGFLRGMLWCGAALAVSLWTDSAAAVYLTPFVGQFFCSQAVQALRLPWHSNPMLWMNMRALLNQSEAATLLAAALFTLAACGACGWLFLREGRRLLEA